MSAIEVQDVCMRFGAVPVLQDVSFSVNPGEFFSIIGPSGCGKSTLLRLVSDIVTPASGTVRVVGKTPDQARRDFSIGFVFQDSTLLPWRTALKNVELVWELVPRSARSEATPQELLSLVGLAGFENHYPRQLSGGMKQRVSIARALASKPSVLLMDEPFGALDEITRERMHKELLRITAGIGATVVFVTHSIPEAVFLSDRMMVVTPRPGRVREIVTIDLPRPRLDETKRTPQFHAYVNELSRLLAEGWVEERV